MSGLKSKLIVFGLPVFLAAGYVVNEYVYSFTGFAAGEIGACESKSIRASALSADGFKKLGFPFDFSQSAAALDSDPNYAIVPGENTLSVSRMFGKLKYTITFETRDTENGAAVFYRYSISCPDCAAPETGDDCATANFRIYKNVYQMIKDLSLGHRTENELQSNLMIYSQPPVPH